MGEAHWLLGVEIKRDQCTCTIMLSQKVYIDAICTWYCLQDARLATTPMEARAQLTDAGEDEPQSDYPYKDLVRSLMYTAMATWLDIAFATSILGQFAQVPARVHWEATKRVVRYLKTTHEIELTYGTGHANLSGYSDDDHVSQLH